MQGDPSREVGCARCGDSWRAEEGVLRFVRAGSLGSEQSDELAVRDQQAAEYDESMPPMADSVEAPLGVAALGVRAGDAVAELGAGTGRYTRGYAGKARAVAALDFSMGSLLLLRAGLPAALRQRVLLVQADAGAPPLRPGAFDRSAAFNMVQHLPTPQQRLEVVRRGAALAKPGGPFVLTAYNWSLAKQRLAALGEGDYTRRDGFHESGVFYHNFDQDELRAIFAEAGLRVDRVQGLILGFKGGRLLGPLLAPFNRLVAGSRWCVARSHYILVRGVRREEGAS